MNDYLAGFGEWALIAQGCILLIVIVFFRRGFVGDLAALSAFVMKRVPRRDAVPLAIEPVGEQPH
jgi:branched-chain amino acid transport system permease protein